MPDKNPRRQLLVLFPKLEDPEELVAQPRFPCG